ncbi:hypothetical protein B566_EDAN003551 [Ephemera danica]|nr:hypothetical protein B566_EDAN003551 [Ephemera danica]
MRRSQLNKLNFGQAAVGLEEDIDELTGELKSKIGLLRTLAIEMGQEVKYHHNLLDGLTEGMESSQGFLGKTMDRVRKLGQGSQNYHLFFLIFFCILMFLIMWFVLKL